MIQLPCPWCGPRNATEFHHRGEVTPRPEVASVTPEEWRRYLYFRRNACDWVEESWYHAAGCRRFFKVRRHTSTNEIVQAGRVQ
ncbi:sarcosine oxidase subunit delta [Planosporangium flavigriseum]|uniref:Sarcosine oxidase subunit delta n=1 Tax=Planosporangium flavigriseum TaxID=373681 RepID=A0A8J3LWV1_9ACTN|nr:sarcosine oxidase subunit delta [Planosporangium flavigriseum]NJC65527.1 sarcosine oxidase subunit delta [Planosporangium flavigriseum]GIG75036.1 sarcosine oxidase subunit delta [Planosporangium flavigriseum]